MKNLRKSSVLISGIGSVGVEIAKNLILGGVRSITIHDTKNCEWRDLSAQVEFLIFKVPKWEEWKCWYMVTGRGQGEEDRVAACWKKWRISIGTASPIENHNIHNGEFIPIWRRE